MLLFCSGVGVFTGSDRYPMPAFLLYLRSSLRLGLIEDDLDEYEQAFLPQHYVLCREGYTATYVVIPDRSDSELFVYLQEKAAKLRLVHLSLLEVGKAGFVEEHGCGEPFASDF